MDYITFSQGVHVLTAVNRESIKWWDRRFGMYPILPRDICQQLIEGIDYPPRFDLTRMLTEPRLARFEIESFDEIGEVYRAERELVLDDGGSLHQCFLDIRPNLRDSGIGTHFARNCYNLAQRYGLSRLTVKAVAGGSYYWARAGFLPSRESWNGPDCKPAIRTRLDAIPGLSPTVRGRAEAALDSSEPKDIWQLTALRTLVRSKDDPSRHVTLGRSLLGESGASWEGSILFLDHELHERQHARARLYMGLGPLE